MKTIYFDMDGTIADLYSVENWLAQLKQENPTPYEKAKPMQDMKNLSSLLKKAQEKGVKIGIISWLSKNSSKEYKKAVTKTKREWLEKYLLIEIDEMHFVQYGTRKDYVAKDKQGIIFDDDERVRSKWRGIAYEPESILEVLKELVR